MQGIFPGDRFANGFERAALALLQLLLMVVIAAAIVILWVILVEAFATKLGSVHTIPELQFALQRAFAGVLLVLLGLELLETVRSYIAEHRIRLEVILIVAIIAVGRHVIQIDFEHVEGEWLLGVGALVLALTGGYFLIKKAQPDARAAPRVSGDQRE